jgi:hypothetical protein
VEILEPWLGVALASFGAVCLGYFLILSRREGPVSFNVPLPPEVRPTWTGRDWDDVQGEEKRVLEGQVKGVSCPFQSIAINADSCLCLAMERKPDRELLSCRWENPGRWNQTGNTRGNRQSSAGRENRAG